MPSKDPALGARGRAREYAKIALRSALFRRGVDIVRNPYPVQVATTLDFLGLDTVLDVGANIGQYGSALRASGFSGRIVSCEPLPDAFAHLTRRSRKDAAWTVLPTAVGDAPGHVELGVSGNSFSSSVLPMSSTFTDRFPGAEFVRMEKVPVTTVADIVTDHGIDPTRTLLKIDTQGYEVPVLDGAGPVLGTVAAVQLELSFVPLYDGQRPYRELLDRMLASGFVLYGLESGFADPRSGRLYECDALFVRSELVR